MDYKGLGYLDLMDADFARAESAAFASYALRPDAIYLHSNDPEIRIRALVAGAGEPVVLLHGITLPAVHWAPVISRLKLYRCSALEMPGHGGSDPFDFDGVDLRAWHVRLLSNCLDELGLHDAHFVGHSYGAMFALWLALAAPSRVRSIVVVGTPSVALGARPDLLLSMLARRLIGRTILSAPMTFAIYRRILSMSLGAGVVKAAPAELIRATYLASRQPGFAQTVSSYMRAQQRAESRERYVLSHRELSELVCPILILWGNEDRRYQLPEEGRRVASLIPTARFETVPGGHEPWFDDLDACTSHISGFLERVSQQKNSAWAT